MYDHFRIGFALKMIAVRKKLLAKRAVVLDNAVMDDGESAVVA